MPCIVQDKAHQSVRFAQQMIENIHREDFSPIDKARAIIEYKGLLGEGKPWSEVEQKIGISESRRKQFVSLLNLPAEIQSEIVAIGKRPSKNQLTEKHARALLMLNKMPDKQAELFNIIKNDKTKITGDEAIEKAKTIIGKKPQLIFRLTYQNREELIEKLEHALSKLKNKNKGVPRCPLNSNGKNGILYFGLQGLTIIISVVLISIQKGLMIRITQFLLPQYLYDIINLLVELAQ